MEQDPTLRALYPIPRQLRGEHTKQSVTPNLSTNGYAFGYWKINGVRQAGDDNRSLTQVSTSISANTTFTAYYFSESEDTDSDGIMDWYEYRMFGSLSMGPTDDPDGDGFNNKRESELGQDPLIVDCGGMGRISGRLSTGFTYADTSMVLAVVKSDPAGSSPRQVTIWNEQHGDHEQSARGHQWVQLCLLVGKWGASGRPTGVAMSKVSQNVSDHTLLPTTNQALRIQTGME